MKDIKPIELTIEKLVFGGKALARLPDGKVVFVIGDVLPQEKVLAQFIKNRKDFAEAKIVKRIADSSSRIEAPCPHFGACGGCAVQNLNYNDQLKIKTGFVEESAKNIGKLQDLKINKIIGSEQQWRYRHKVELTFLEDKNKNINIGFYYKGSWWNVVDIKDCLLFDEKLKEILKIVKSWVAKKQLTVFNHRNFTGLLRNLIIKKTYYTDEWMAGIVISEEADQKIFKDLINDFKKFINLKSFYQRIIKAKRSKGETFKDNLLFGQDFITEFLNNIKFKIKFNSFFQNNTLQAEEMIRYVLSKIQNADKGPILDLYCGAGTFTLPLAKKFKNKIVGVELIQEAIDSAKECAKINKVTNAEFICADASKAVKEIIEKYNFEIAIADPPRAGLTANVIEQIQNSNIKTFIYVSCDPSTLARDLNLLGRKFKILEIQPFDLFPQTYHVECIAVLKRCRDVAFY